MAQYEAVSFGDALFSSFLSLPLQQRYNNMFRRAVWNEHTGVFRSFGLTFDEVSWCISIVHIAMPQRSNTEGRLQCFWKYSNGIFSGGY